MNLLRDRDRSFSLYLLEVLEDSWGNVGGFLGTGGDKLPNFCDLIAKWFGETY